MRNNMRTPITRRIAALGPLLAVGACTKGFQDPSAPDRFYSRDLAGLTYRAVDRLLERSTPQLTVAAPVLVSSLTDSLRVEKSSRFGTIIADLAKSRLAQGGMAVSEPRLRSAMLLKRDEGELMLARDSRAIIPGPAYSCVLTGTYAAADSRVYVALKLLSADNARIISTVDFVVWRNNDVNRLLGEALPTEA